MAAGEMNREEFAAFNRAWMSSAAFYVIDGGLIGTFIDWRSVELVLARRSRPRARPHQHRRLVEVERGALS